MSNKQKGFTLLELMVTLAIVGIVASIVLWNSSDMLEENRAESFLLELKRNISYARSQAASTDEIVILCAGPQNQVKNNQDKIQCKNEWGENKMIIVFIDSNNDGEYTRSSDSLLRVMDKISSQDKLTFTGNEKRLRFNTSGRITTEPGDFVFCPANSSDNNKALTVSQAGSSFYLGKTSQKCG